MTDRVLDLSERPANHSARHTEIQNQRLCCSYKGKKRRDTCKGTQAEACATGWVQVAQASACVGFCFRPCGVMRASSEMESGRRATKWEYFKSRPLPGHRHVVFCQRVISDSARWSHFY